MLLFVLWPRGWRPRLRRRTDSVGLEQTA